MIKETPIIPISIFATFVMIKSDLQGIITARPRKKDFVNNPKILATNSKTPISAYVNSFAMALLLKTREIASMANKI